MAGEHAGQSLVGQLWNQLDAQYAKLKVLHGETGGVTAESLTDALTDEEGPEDVDSWAAKAISYLQTQGKVQAMAYSVGTILYPYDTAKERIDKVRAELPQRWADNNPDEEE